MGKMTLDPNAVVYTDDEIVGKVNAAAVNITRVDAVEDAALKESADFQKVSQADEDKLAGIATGAEVNPADLAALDPTQNTKLDGIDEGAKVDQDGDNIVAAIDAGVAGITREDALSQADLKLVKSEPVAGEHIINYIVRKADGKLEADYEDAPEA